MNKFIVFIFLALYFPMNNALAQVNEYSFKIEYLLPDNTTKASSFFNIEFDNFGRKTNSNGIIIITRESGKQSISVSIKDPEYSLIGPSSIAFPDDPNYTTTILVHKKSNTELGAAALAKELKKLNISIEDANAKEVSKNKELKRLIDSVMTLVTLKYKVSEQDIRSAAEILAGRDKYFNAISYSLEGYLNEAKDIRDLFKNILDFAMENPRYFKLLDSTINVYNYFYNNLNNYGNEYEKAVKTYWQSEELAIGFHNVFDYAINNIHRSNILLLNTQFNEKARRYIHETRKKTRKELKGELTNSLNAVLPVLDNNLVVLENKIKYHIGKLEMEREILKN